jgi:hypothetical protein
VILEVFNCQVWENNNNNNRHIFILAFSMCHQNIEGWLKICIS